MDQLTGCTGGGERGRLTGYCGGRFGDRTAASIWAGQTGGGLSVGWESGLCEVGGGGGGSVRGPRHCLLTLREETGKQVRDTQQKDL